MPYPKDPKAFNRWKTALDLSYAADPAPWNQHDTDFLNTAADYNAFHALTPDYVPLDWKMVKALSWVETGAGSAEWTTNVMQIGKFDDPGLNQVLNTATGKLITPTQYKPTLTVNAVQTLPRQNIRAGVGYMLWVFAHFGNINDPAAPPVPAPLPGHASAKPRQILGITGWRPISLTTIADRYNGGGDGNYNDKLLHTYDVVSHGLPQANGASG